MKYSSAALFLGAAATVVADTSADWGTWDPSTSTTSDWSYDPTTTDDWSVSTSTTYDWPADPTTTSAEWGTWDPSTSTGWEDDSTTTWTKHGKTTKTTTYTWTDAAFDPKVCKATSTNTVWAVGTYTVTGTVTDTVYAVPTGGWSGIPSVVTETDTVTVWVGADGKPVSTEWDTATGGVYGGGSGGVYGGGSGGAYGGWSTTGKGAVVTGTETASAWVYDPSEGAGTGGGFHGGIGTEGGAWPEPSDPTAWGPGVVSVIGTNDGAGWSWTKAIPTQTSWTPPSPTYTDNCTAPHSGLPEVGCNDASDRSQWCGAYDIDTNYYKDYPKTGHVCSYDFVITNTTLNFDGTDRLAFAINGQSPGPLIECNWGDTVQIKVTNNLQDNGTAIHWHGIRQVGTNSQDGVPGITECAIAPGSSRTYTWVASSYGTSWYHSHWLTQYGDGIRGPIIIHGPATANYDIDMGTVIVSELFNQTAAQAYDIISHTGPGGSTNYLLNGVNTSPDLSTGKHALWEVQPGKKHLFRFINAAAQNMWSIHFDSHTIEVIAVDFVPIVPYTTSWLNIAIGQRFDVIITADQPSGNYFLRAVTQTGCPSECDNNGLGSANGILNYVGETLTLPTSNTGNVTITDFATCADEPIASITPHVSVIAGSSTAFSAQASTLPAGNVALTQTSNDGAIFRWFLNGGAIDVNYTQPTLQSLAQGDNSSISNVVYLNTANTWVYFVIQNQFFAGHPIHLHGHDFSLLGQASGSQSPRSPPTLFTSADVSSLNFNNPPRRDTAMLAGNGWTVIGFETDNPGAWLMHCHIVWHVDGGLAMEFVERPDEIDAGSYVDSDFQNECSSYATYEAASPSHLKTDGESGLRRRGWYEPEWMGSSNNVVRRSESHEKRFLESHLKRGFGDSYKPRHARR